MWGKGASRGLGFGNPADVTDSGLERKETVVKGTTHWERREDTRVEIGID